MSTDRERRVDEAIAEYLAGCDAGRPPNRTAFLSKYPDLADSLGEFLDDHARMRGAAGREPEAGGQTVALPAAPTGSLGTVRYIGDYELLGEIARGGMGVVFKARQQSLDRLVAVKMILAGRLAGARDVQRFHTEAKAAANLQHPNIVGVYEVGEHAGQHYFSMEYVEGTSLAALVREHPLPANEAARHVAAIARAIHYAH